MASEEGQAGQNVNQENAGKEEKEQGANKGEPWPSLWKLVDACASTGGSILQYRWDARQRLGEPQARARAGEAAEGKAIPSWSVGS